jgi:hypothetical protein
LFFDCVIGQGIKDSRNEAIPGREEGYSFEDASYGGRRKKHVSATNSMPKADKIRAGRRFNLKGEA